MAVERRERACGSSSRPSSGVRIRTCEVLWLGSLLEGDGLEEGPARLPFVGISVRAFYILRLSERIGAAAPTHRADWSSFHEAGRGIAARMVAGSVLGGRGGPPGGGPCRRCLLVRAVENELGVLIGLQLERGFGASCPGGLDSVGGLSFRQLEESLGSAPVDPMVEGQILHELRRRLEDRPHQDVVLTLNRAYALAMARAYRDLQQGLDEVWNDPGWVERNALRLAPPALA